MPMKPILHSFAYSLDFLREQVADIRDADMVAQPKGLMNHPAWIIGHLSFTCQMLAGSIGVSPWLPEDFAARYGTGSTPQPNLGAYESKVIALEILRDAQLRITGAVERLDAARLDDEFPAASLRDVFPTILHALTQVLVGHTAFHVGQVSVWRKAMALPAMDRSYE